MTLPTHGILAIDLDRDPGPDDWLAVALGSQRLVPVRTARGAGGRRLAVVVRADPPPSNDALLLLARLAATGALRPVDPERTPPPDRRWSEEVAARILAAVADARPAK
jgi:hypothetical protein